MGPPLEDREVSERSTMAAYAYLGGGADEVKGCACVYICAFCRGDGTDDGCVGITSQARLQQVGQLGVAERHMAVLVAQRHDHVACSTERAEADGSPNTISVVHCCCTGSFQRSLSSTE